MLGVAAIPSLALAIGILKMPESPRWLAFQGRLAESKKMLMKVSLSEKEAERRFRDIKIAAGIDENCTDDVVKISKTSKNEQVWKELFLKPTPAVRRILFTAIGLHFFDHATGIEAILLFGPRIFKKAGVHEKSKLLLATVGTGITKTVFIFIATFYIDKRGRRPLLMISAVGMFVALAVVATSLTIAENHDEPLWALVVSLIAVYTFVAFFSMGMGPIAWIYLSEMFPMRVRGLGVGIGVAVNRLMNATVSLTFISLTKALTIGGAFFLYCGFGFLSLLFIYFCLPETKGKTLEEIESLFSKKKKNVDAEAMQPNPNK